MNEEYRILNEMVNRHQRHAKCIAVLVPKIMVANPFLYEAYLRVSKHHKNLSLINNEKLLDPKSYNLMGLGKRVGNAEQFMREVDIKGLLNLSINSAKSKHEVLMRQ
jgi:hypothetical protein